MENSNLTTDTRKNTEMAIVEKPMEWLKNFNANWLAHIEKTGEIDWDKYKRTKNAFSPSGNPINLADSKIMLISSSGAYLPEYQQMFDQYNKLGDYSLRAIPSSSKFSEIKFSHTHYDHQFIDLDPQVLLPLRHMEDFANEGLIGEICDTTLIFSGYQPNAIRVVKELIPKILDIVKSNKVDGVLLVPA